MILDYNPANGRYWLLGPDVDPRELMVEYGFDLANGRIPFTKEPYAAVTFAAVGTPRAQENLAYLSAQIERSWATSSTRQIAVPGDKELWPFQVASAAYALDHPHTLIGDEPGLGKTPIAIAIANEMQAQRVLVICPASIRLQWLRRISEWSTLPDAYARAVLSSKKGIDDNAAWTVVSWDLVRSEGIWRALAKGTYDLLILDEAHYAKSADRRRTRAIFGGGRGLAADPIASRAAKIIALTGTPLPNRPREAYTLARNLCWEAIDFFSEDTFNERFNPRQTGRTRDGRVWVDERVGRTAELQNRLRANFMVRHLKRDVMPQLKLPVFDLIRVEETRAVKAALQAESLLGIDPEDLSGADADVLGHIAAARRQMGVAMAPQVASYLTMLLEGEENKLVVFAWHVEVLDILCQALHAYQTVRVDGSDSAKAKDRKVREFIDRPDVRVIFGNVLSLGTGTDGLQTVCSHALLAEADWVHGNNVQCFDRLDRGGQREQVQGEIFVAPGSLAERVLASALRKAQVTFKALDRRVA